MLRIGAIRNEARVSVLQRSDDFHNSVRAWSIFRRCGIDTLRLQYLDRDNEGKRTRRREYLVPQVDPEPRRVRVETAEPSSEAMTTR